MAKVTAVLDDLCVAVRLACESQNASRIMAGRQQVLAMPRPWVLEHIERVATETLNLADFWEYRRLLELAVQLDEGLVQRLVPLGLKSNDREVREAAEDFRTKR